MSDITLVTREELDIFKKQLLDEIKQLIANQNPAQKKWFKTNEACKILGCALSKLARLRVRNQITYKRVGKVYYYELENL